MSKNKNNPVIFTEMQKRFPSEFQMNIEKNISTHIKAINEKWSGINKNMLRINDVLDTAIHGHKTAKRQLKRIIGQWMNGKQTGYCFGFEGPPGVKHHLLKRDWHIV